MGGASGDATGAVFISGMILARVCDLLGHGMIARPSEKTKVFNLRSCESNLFCLQCEAIFKNTTFSSSGLIT